MCQRGVVARGEPKQTADATTQEAEVFDMDYDDSMTHAYQDTFEAMEQEVTDEQNKRRKWENLFSPSED